MAALPDFGWIYLWVLKSFYSGVAKSNRSQFGTRKNMARDTPMLSLVRRKICPSNTTQSSMPRDSPTLSLVRRMSDASDTPQPSVSRYTQCATLARTFARRTSDTSDSTQSSMVLYMPIETLPWRKRRCALPIPTYHQNNNLSLRTCSGCIPRVVWERNRVPGRTTTPAGCLRW